MQASCPEATEAEQMAFRDAMAKCFALAVSHGLSIAVTPHVDDGLGLGDSTRAWTCRETLTLPCLETLTLLRKAEGWEV